ncbi:haloacid dehalogenase-like hydrolase domain-containing protein 2 [Opisthocomus hoazin]|uniref:haloacid dehalogenase-like hydrolase domain-containing protein 2 n=1 Tax=Opisthocomus hoazin TaxID=30419 RepID=UPI003F52D0D9
MQVFNSKEPNSSFVSKSLGNSAVNWEIRWDVNAPNRFTKATEGGTNSPKSCRFAGSSSSLKVRLCSQSRQGDEGRGHQTVTSSCCLWLILDGVPLIAIHKARYFKKNDGLALGCGPFVAGLEYTTDTKATVVGKPEKTFFLEALQGTGCDPEEAVMIGDDCRDDVGGAQNAGMHGGPVSTRWSGKYRLADEAKINPAPYFTCENFPEAVEHILEHPL